MGIIVQKYGGSSVATMEKIKKQARRIAWRQAQGHQIVVVVSAQGDTTDDLLAKSQAVSTRPSPREMDVLLSCGEQISMALMAMALHELGVPAVSLTGHQAGIHTDTNHRAARVLEVKTDRIRRELVAGKVVIVAGFQGVDSQGDITTLGRGGSDASAIVLAAELRAEACQIFTDVDGVYTADPRVVTGARRLDEISFEELMELAASGSQVMQLRSVEFARLYGVEFEVLSSLASLPAEGGAEKGTRVVSRLSSQYSRVVSGVALNNKIVRISLLGVPDQPGVASRLFSAFAKTKVVIDDIVQSGGPGATQADISITVNQDDLDMSLEIIRDLMPQFPGAQLVYDPDVAKVSIVGSAVASNYGVAANMFEALADNGINIEMITGSEIKISCLVRASQSAEAVRVIHAKFQLDKADAAPAAASRSAGTP